MVLDRDTWGVRSIARQGMSPEEVQAEVPNVWIQPIRIARSGKNQP